MFSGGVAARPARERKSLGTRPLRVIQWATGVVGRHAVAAIAAHPELELVGARVYSEAKAGRDVGELCGIGPTGVVATTSTEEVLALDADCVLYAAQGEMDPLRAVEDICRLLASGKNVISTAVTGLIHPKSLGRKIAARIEEACQKGNASFHGTGIEPGWAAEVLPLTMSGLFRRIESICVQELLDYATYPSAAMLMDIMGFGRPPDAPVPMADPRIAGATFRAPILLVADGLGASVEDFSYTRDVAVADRTFLIAAGEIREGTVAAQRFSTTGIVAGRPAITVEHITRVAADQAPHWPRGRGWRVRIEGEPSMALEATIAVNGEDENDQGCLGTAMHAVHAIPHVCAAAPGIRTFLDLPMITGRGTFAFGRAGS
jgi:2,4-diaminopentanoate dehydrogenase